MAPVSATETEVTKLTLAVTGCWCACACLQGSYYLGSFPL